MWQDVPGSSSQQAGGVDASRSSNGSSSQQAVIWAIQHARAHPLLAPSSAHRSRPCRRWRSSSGGNGSRLRERPAGPRRLRGTPLGTTRSTPGLPVCGERPGRWHGQEAGGGWLGGRRDPLAVGEPRALATSAAAVRRQPQQLQTLSYTQPAVLMAHSSSRKAHRQAADVAQVVIFVLQQLHCRRLLLRVLRVPRAAAHAGAARRLHPCRLHLELLQVAPREGVRVQRGAVVPAPSHRFERGEAQQLRLALHLDAALAGPPQRQHLPLLALRGASKGWV